MRELTIQATSDDKPFKISVPDAPVLSSEEEPLDTSNMYFDINQQMTMDPDKNAFTGKQLQDLRKYYMLLHSTIAQKRGFQKLQDYNREVSRLIDEAIKKRVKTVKANKKNPFKKEFYKDADKGILMGLRNVEKIGTFLKNTKIPILSQVSDVVGQTFGAAADLAGGGLYVKCKKCGKIIKQENINKHLKSHEK